MLNGLVFRLRGEANACGAFFAIERDTFLKLGGFPERFAADSILSRVLSKSHGIEPVPGLEVCIQPRKLRLGCWKFARYAIAILLTVSVPFLRGRGYFVRQESHIRNGGYGRAR